MNQLGQKNVSGNELFRILSAPIIYRKGEVIYTTVMNARDGDYKTIIREY